MIHQYRMRTSLGHVILSFDDDNFEKIEWKGNAGAIKSAFHNKNFIIEHRREYINQLYKGELSHIRKTENGDFFAIIELDDPYYGDPEYYLERIL